LHQGWPARGAPLAPAASTAATNGAMSRPNSRRAFIAFISLSPTTCARPSMSHCAQAGSAHSSAHSSARSSAPAAARAPRLRSATMRSGPRRCRATASHSRRASLRLPRAASGRICLAPQASSDVALPCTTGQGQGRLYCPALPPQRLGPPQMPPGDEARQRVCSASCAALPASLLSARAARAALLFAWGREALITYRRLLRKTRLRAEECVVHGGLGTLLVLPAPLEESETLSSLDKSGFPADQICCPRQCLGGRTAAQGAACPRS